MNKNKIKKYYTLELGIPGEYMHQYVILSKSRFKCFFLIKKYIYGRLLKKSALEKYGLYLTSSNVIEEYCQPYKRGVNDV